MSKLAKTRESVEIDPLFDEEGENIQSNNKIKKGKPPTPKGVLASTITPDLSKYLDNEEKKEFEDDPADDENDDDVLLQNVRENILKSCGEDGLKAFDEEIEKIENSEKNKEEDIMEDPREVTQNISREKVEKSNEEISGGFVKYVKKNQDNLDELNRSADFILNCLPPGIKKDFEVAAFDNGVEDLGIFIIGLLNQMYKMGDYYNPDIENEWTKKSIGYRGNLTCQYCGKTITDPRHVDQLYCNNTCAKNAKENKPGLVFPREKEYPTEEEIDKKNWEREQFNI